MATRDTVLAERASIYSRAREKGFSSDDLDTSLRGNPRLYANGMMTLINSSVDTPGRYRLKKELPPNGTFDGANATFYLAGAVLGKNIGVDHITQSTGAVTPLTLTDNPTPIAGSFYLDAPNGAIILGLAPQPLDNISVTYLARR